MPDWPEQQKRPPVWKPIDYLLINDDLDRCVEEMHQLIQLQHRKPSYHLDFLSKMREDLYPLR